MLVCNHHMLSDWHSGHIAANTTTRVILATLQATLCTYIRELGQVAKMGWIGPWIEPCHTNDIESDFARTLGNS